MTKSRFPFRLGTTSYIIPADILPNLRYLSGKVDDVELVLFEGNDFSNLPSKPDIATMRALAEDNNLTYTVHLPLDMHLGSADEQYRRVSVDRCRRIIDLTASLSPFAYVLHLSGDCRGDSPSRNITQWQERHAESLSVIVNDGLPSRKIAVETLDYDFCFAAELVSVFDLSVCLDVGHLLVMDRDVPFHFHRWFDRTKIVHFHGVRPDKTDHADLGHLSEETVDTVLSLMVMASQEERVLTLEVFNQRDFEKSVDVLTKRLKSWQR